MTAYINVKNEKNLASDNFHLNNCFFFQVLLIRIEFNAFVRKELAFQILNVSTCYCIVYLSTNNYYCVDEIIYSYSLF